MDHVTTIILAAGKGTRMKSRVPKVLHALCGKPIIQHVLEAVHAAGSLKTYVVLGHQSGQVREALGPDVTTYEQKDLLGTADAVRQGERFFRDYTGDILILCGDTPLLRKETIRSVIRRHKRTGAACTFLTAFLENSHGYGRVIRHASGKAVAIREEKDASLEEKKIREINVGVYCVHKDALFSALRDVPLNAKKKEYYLTDMVAILAQRGAPIETVGTPDAMEGVGINSREDLAVAERVLRFRVLRKLMLSGVTIVDPATTYIDGKARIGQDTIIHPCTVIETNVTIGEQCVIGPFARIRPGTRIGNRVQIGNFAEVSRSVMGEHCFMKHFSFLGDARLGANVNIGAGVVTANYDGKNKNQTRVGARAFVGSDSILVAPVEIGPDAMTGAGCVVTRGTKVPPGNVIVGVPGRIRKKKE
ncbi:MAG TPA: NTP transferase domain-containing protein [Candidatus Omnitrophota bacterium]|nr:NTP transferase domain-containing protein [Candidatus Omnitrophota bacterium]